MWIGGIDKGFQKRQEEQEIQKDITVRTWEWGQLMKDRGEWGQLMKDSWEWGQPMKDSQAEVTARRKAETETEAARVATVREALKKKKKKREVCY